MKSFNKLTVILGAAGILFSQSLAAQPVVGPNGNYYELVSTTATWDAAKTAAEGMTHLGLPGYLATATSLEENNFIATLGASTSAYFGGFQPPGTAEPAEGWEWVSGEAWSFTAWGPGEPNDSGGEDCIHYRTDGLWNDISCAGVRPYVVEYDAPEFDLALSAADAPDPVVAGSGVGNLTHTFTLSRSGPADATGVTVTLTDSNFPTGVTPDTFTPSVGVMNGTTWEVGDWAADQNGIDQTLVVALTVDGSVDTCADCIFAEYTVAAASGTDTDSSNDSAVDPTSVTGTTDLAFTFATSVDPIDAGTPDVTLSCNAGLPLVQTAPVGTTFTVKELREGDVCTVTMGDLDGDWVGHVYECSGTGVATESGCEFTIDAEAVASTVNVLAIPAAFEYTANLMWEISPDADPGIEDGAMLMATCENVFVGVHGANGPLTTTTVTVAGDMDTFAAIEALPDPNGSTECFAELLGVGSAVEVMNDCGPETVEVGDGMVDCDITATAFFEGIPTLSQYGMALMALLMLGVGFVGFRRFI